MLKVKWGVCLGVSRFPMKIGLITEEYPKSYQIRDSEEQSYPTEIWNKDYVKVFGQPQEAAEYFTRLKKESEGSAMERLVRSFPKIFSKLK